MAVTRLTLRANPTNKDLQAAIKETHGCVHQVDKKVQILAAAMGVKLPSEEELAAGYALGKVHRRLGGLRPWHAASIAIPVIAGGMTAYKVIEPAVVAFAEALHHALMTAH